MINGVATYFVGTHYEVTGSEITKYYYAGSQRIAMRKNGTLTYILGDHLGSTSFVTDANGAVINQTKYKAWGETRYSSGTNPTDYTYTGQYSYTSDFGLRFYNARWYDPSLGRFAQADTIVPLQSQGVQAWDRYAYVNNSPINYTDPTGHLCEDENTWGYCGGKLPSPKNVKKEDRERYMRDIARKFNLNLAPGDYWEYLDYVDVGQGSTAGWVPEKENDPYFDRNGDLQFSNDPPVYITDLGFEACYSDTCLAGIMAHESTHSWVELLIEQTSPTGNPRISEYIFAEEMLADTIAMQVGDPQGLLQTHFFENQGYCENIFGVGSCSNPLAMIEEYYAIDLSDLASDVYGR